MIRDFQRASRPAVYFRLRRSFSGLMFGALVVSGASEAQSLGPQDEIRALGNCSECVLENADYSGDRLIGLDLEDARLSDVSFAGAKLSIAVFDGAVLERVSFAGTDLRGASFVRALLIDVDFNDADLAGAVFDDAILQRTDLSSARRCNTQTPSDEMDNANCGRN